MTHRSATHLWSDAHAAGIRAGAGLVLAHGPKAQGATGEALGTSLGQSSEFVDHREYQAGDDPRRIDWSALARSDRLVVRKYQDEVYPVVEIIIDRSKSMNAPASPKGHTAIALASAIGDAAVRSGHQVSTHAATPTRTERVEHLADWPGFDASTTPLFETPSLHAVGCRVVISDLLFPADPQQLSTRWARSASRLIVAQTLARDDLDPGQPGTIRLRDRESGTMAEIAVDQRVIERVRERARAHARLWSDACQRVGATFLTLIAEDHEEPTDLAATLVRARILEPR